MGQSQDGVLGGSIIRISSQLGHLPGTRGGPQTPKGTGGNPSDRVGREAWGSEGGGEVEARQEWRP